MGARRWHVAHADGREWTRREMCIRFGYDPLPVIDMDGRLGLHLIHTDGKVAMVVWNPEDMMVVWDG